MLWYSFTYVSSMIRPPALFVALIIARILRRFRQIQRWQRAFFFFVFFFFFFLFLFLFLFLAAIASDRWPSLACAFGNAAEVEEKMV